ncbi:LacI family DNA-binding transcriptional regulator [Bacillus sp. JJ1127]|uniref:LacI family DNA-binding transcriptional regulator n=1 Tax=Bacillus sp. JJ1127 TaxID=3122952 RepID=UPI002FFE0664
MNHHPYVRSELRERVQAIIDEKNYVPVAVAKDLRRLQTNLIGVVVPSLHHPFFSQLIQEISDILKGDCYDVVILQSNFDTNREREFIQYVRTKKLDGLIFATLSLPIEEIECASTSGTIVICNEHVETELISTVQFDEERAGYLGTKHLLEKGYTRIGFCYDTLKSKAQRMGICVPKDFGVIGFDNQELSMMMNPNITTIHTSIASMAKTSIALLHKQSQGERTQRLQLPISVIERESTRRKEEYVPHKSFTIS